MRFVLGNFCMARAGGAEVHLLTLGEQLRRLGHEATIYAVELGPYADYVRQHGFDVAGELGELPSECDVVLAQDTIVSHDLMARYPQALQTFRICSDLYDFAQPPQLPGATDLVLVLSDRYARLAQACAVQAPLQRLRVPIDTNRVVPIGSIRARPKRAVVLGNYGSRRELVRETWSRLGIEVTEIGGAKQRYDLSAALAGVDIVVAKSRAALDAMACGRAVYIYDFIGGDGWVTPDNYAALEADNFAGHGTSRVIDGAALERDLADYDPAMGAVNRDLVVQHHDARQHTLALLAAIEAHHPSRRPDVSSAEISRLTALQWSWERTARELQVALGEAHAHNALLQDHVSALQTEADSAQRRTSELQAQLETIRSTRAWRLTTRYWRLKQRVADPALRNRFRPRA
jgi:hypothetical protein